MQSMTVSSFKMHALGVINSIATDKITVVITKRGKPVARIIPYNDDIVAEAGRLASVLISQGDIVSPINNEWEANQ